MPQPTHRDLRRFCELDQWEHYRTDHDRYEKLLEDGTVLRTKVSFGAGGIDDPALWQRIWRDQLGLPNEEAFWLVLETGEPVDRSEAPADAAEFDTIAGWIVDHLYRAGYSDDDMAKMTEAEAKELVYEHWARQQEDDE